MKVAVVILNWNGKRLLEQFLPSVVENSREAKIYVADNASEDGSVEFVQNTFPSVEVIQNKTNGGFAKGYNDALSCLKEEIFILLNSDVEVTPGWLPPIIQEFQEHSKTAAIQPKILDYKRRDHFEYAGAAGGFIDMFGYPYCRGRIFDQLEKDEGQYNDQKKIFWASGACLAIRREAFYAAGEFDEEYFAHQEEIDLCWRLFNLNWDVKYIGLSKIYHLGGATLSSMHPKKTFFNFRNSLFSLLKNAPGKKVILLIFSRLVLDGAAGVKFMFDLRPRHTFAIIKAHFSFYSHLPSFLRKRRIHQKRTKYYGITSVLYTYYISGVKKYQNPK